MVKARKSWVHIQEMGLAGHKPSQVSGKAKALYEFKGSKSKKRKILKRMKEKLWHVKVRKAKWCNVKPVTSRAQDSKKVPYLIRRQKVALCNISILVKALKFLGSVLLGSPSCPACLLTSLLLQQHLKVMESSHISTAGFSCAGGFSPCPFLLFQKVLDYTDTLAHIAAWFLKKDSWKKCLRVMHSEHVNRGKGCRALCSAWELPVHRLSAETLAWCCFD